MRSVGSAVAFGVLNSRMSAPAENVLPAPAMHDRVDARVGVRAIDAGDERGAHRVPQPVHRRVVERDDRHAAADVVAVVGHRRIAVAVGCVLFYRRLRMTHPPAMIRDRETLDLLLETVRRFVRERLIPNEHARRRRATRFPQEIVAEMRELGLFGLSLPEEYGGLGLTMEEEVLVAFELARTSPAFRSLIGTNNGIGSQGIVIDGTEAQKARWLPRLASGELIGSFALTEPGSGSDAASLATTARARRRRTTSSTARSASSPTRRRRASSR